MVKLDSTDKVGLLVILPPPRFSKRYNLQWSERIFCWYIISHLHHLQRSNHLQGIYYLSDDYEYMALWVSMLCNQMNLIIKFRFDSLTWFCCNHNPEIFTSHFVAYLCCGWGGCCGQWWNVRTIGALCYYYALTLTHHHRAAQRGDNYL